VGAVEGNCPDETYDMGTITKTVLKPCEEGGSLQKSYTTQKYLGKFSVQHRLGWQVEVTGEEAENSQGKKDARPRRLALNRS